MWSLSTQLALVAIIVAVATTVALLLRSRRPLYVRFAMFAGGITLYYITALITGAIDTGANAATSPKALVVVRILSGVAIIVSATVFFDTVLGEAGVRARHRQRRTVLVGALLSLTAFIPLFPVPDGTDVVIQGVAAFATMILLGGRAVRVLRRSVDVESQADRVRLRYLAWGGIAALSGFGFDLLHQLDWPVPPLGGLTAAIYLYFISQALLVSRLLDLHELLGKALVFGTLAMILAALYGLLVVWVGDRRSLFLFNTLIASSLILILFDPLKTYLEEQTTRVFFREHVTFARAMRQLSRQLAGVIEPDRAVEQVLDAIYDKGRATHTSVYFLDRGGMGFALQGHRGARPVAKFDAEGEPALFSRLIKEPTPLLRDFLATNDAARSNAPLSAEGGSDKPYEVALLEGLDSLKADLVVPVRTGDQILGFLCLRDERLTEAYASDEIAALLQVGEQLAINIENSRLFDVLRERDRLATLGEMSAGLAHEIRNPLAAIKGAAQVLDPAQLDGEDAELLQVIVSEVDRLNTVVTDFLDYARPFRGTFSAFSPNDVVERTVQLIKHDLPDTITLDVDVQPDLPDINGDAERLQQVMLNLVLNASQAMDREGRIQIVGRHVASAPGSSGLRDLRGEASDWVELRVIDDGPGIPRAVRDNLFIPFFTTKDSGTGLGLALCQRIVQHHGGNIEVMSTEGQGATFTVRLPSLRKKASEPKAETAALPPPEEESLVPSMEPSTAEG